MATWEDYRQWVDSRLAALTPEQLAAVQGAMAHSAMDPDRSQFNAAYKEAEAALRAAGYNEEQASQLFAIAYNVRKHPEVDTHNTFIQFTGALPVNPEKALTDIQGLPGQRLDTTKSEEDKRRTDDFVAALQKQASTGGGAWEQALQQSKEAAASQATSLAQSQPGTDAGETLRAMGAGQAAAAMQASAAEEKLRTQQKQKAAEQLSSVLGGTQTLEAAQAEMQAAAQQAAAEAEKTKEQQQTKAAMGMVGGLGQAGAAVAAAMSDGGTVPGKAKVFGDDEANDTVPAMLSPGEIVIPRSIATAPDADKKAADFVAHVKAKHGMQNFDDGGQVWPTDPSAGVSFPFTSSPLSKESGALLETGPYSQARAAALKNLDENLMPMAMGRGPSVIPWETKANIDEANAAAMQAMAKGHAPGDLSRRVGASSGKAAAGEAGRAQQEQAHEMDVATRAALEQRQRDLQFAKAQQEAAWRNTMMNMGIDLQNQAAIRGMLSGAGQGLTAFGTQLAKESTSPLPESQIGNASEWAEYQPSPADSSMESPSNLQASEGKAHGGVVSDHKRLRSFLAAMGA